MATSALFDAVRHISAVDAAERAGVQMVKRGGCFWARCPLHGERTPSLKFYGDTGGFYCFGCHRGGDAVRLYEELYRVEPVEAARMLVAAFGIAVDDSLRAGPPPEPKAGKRHAERAAEVLYAQLWDTTCAEKWRAQAVLDGLHTEGAADWDNPVFVAALKVRSLADERLAALDSYGLDEKLEQLDEGGAPGE